MADVHRRIDKAEIDALKRTADADLLVTDDDLQALAEAEEDLRHGRTRII